MTTRAICFEARSPMFFQVRPPSADLKMPSPHDDDWRLLFSPVPAQMRLGSVGAIAMSPTDDVLS
jgi:hypothetical protein